MGGTRAAVEGALHHPQGVQPWGNYLFAQGRDTRNEGGFCSLMGTLPYKTTTLSTIHHHMHYWVHDFSVQRRVL